MNDRRNTHHDRGYGNPWRDREQSMQRHRGAQPHYGGGNGWDTESRDQPRYRSAGDDRFGGYGESYGYGGTYPPSRDAGRGQGDWGRSSAWDEDRFGHAESGRYGRPAGRRDHGYDPYDRFADDSRHDRGTDTSGMGYRNFGESRFDRDLSWNRSNWNHDQWYPESRSAGGPGDDSFAGGRRDYGYGERDRSRGDRADASGGEFGAYGMENHPRGGSNWNSGNSWSGGFGDDARFTGRGGNDRGLGRRTPKGYTRSDERIKDDVCEQLYRSDDVDVSEVTVEARSGTVTLEGSVPDRRMKHRIEDICERCIGVTDVENRIRVLREGDRTSFERGAGAGGRSAQDEASGFGGSTASVGRKMSGGPASSSH